MRSTRGEGAASVSHLAALRRDNGDRQDEGLETETQDRTEFWEQGRVNAGVLTERSRWGVTTITTYLIYFYRTIGMTILVML